MSQIQTFGLENGTKFSLDFRRSDIRISDIRAVRFVRLFGYTLNVRNLNVRSVESINRTSEIQTKWFRFQTLSEIRTVWEWDNFGKRQNPNIRISDSSCIGPMDQLQIKHIFKYNTDLYYSDISYRYYYTQNRNL